MKLGITFGALAPKISEQLKKQGVSIVGIAIRRAQNDADAVALLLVRGTLSEVEARNARRRIIKQLKKANDGIVRRRSRPHE